MRTYTAHIYLQWPLVFVHFDMYTYRDMFLYYLMLRFMAILGLDPRSCDYGVNHWTTVVEIQGNHVAYFVMSVANPTATPILRVSLKWKRDNSPNVAYIRFNSDDRQLQRMNIMNGPVREELRPFFFFDGVYFTKPTVAR